MCQGVAGDLGRVEMPAAPPLFMHKEWTVEACTYNFPIDFGGASFHFPPTGNYRDRGQRCDSHVSGKQLSSQASSENSPEYLINYKSFNNTPALLAWVRCVKLFNLSPTDRQWKNHRGPGQKKETQRAGEMLPTMKLPGPRDGKRGPGLRNSGQNANCQQIFSLWLDCWHDILGTGSAKEIKSHLMSASGKV